MIAELDLIQDELLGLRVKPAFYLDLHVDYDDDVADMIDDQERESEYVMVPFVVMRWDDGLDYDEDGVAYFDDYPQWYVVSLHRTRRGAEMQVDWLVDGGNAEKDVTIDADHWVQRWELRYHQWSD